MKKYKISKHNLKEFFGIFGLSQKERDEKINNIIDNDPVLKQIDANMRALDQKAVDRVKKDKELLSLMKKTGLFKVIKK